MCSENPTELCFRPHFHSTIIFTGNYTQIHRQSHKCLAARVDEHSLSLALPLAL